MHTRNNLLQTSVNGVALTFLIVLGLTRPARGAQYVHKSISAPVMFTFRDNLSAGQTVQYDAIGGAGVDPVMHLMNGHGDAPFQITMDDDGGGGLNSRIVFTATSTVAVTIVVRSYSNGSQGPGFFKRNGVTIGAAHFGGTHIPVPAAARSYQTSLAFTGTDDTVILALNAGYYGAAYWFNDDGGVGLASRIPTFSPNAPWVVVGAWSTAGVANSYANDTGDDWDLDGLGVGLERELGVCDRASDPGCGSIFNYADSDRDGIADALEIFGKDDGIHPLHLAKWGADPRRKDVYIELDWRSQNFGDTCGYPSTQTTNPLNVYTDDAGVDCAAGSSPDCRHQAIRITEKFLPGPSGSLRNLQSLDGVAVHLDIGINNPTQASQPYGDFGGSNMYDYFDSSRPGCNPPNNQPTCHALSFASRRGIFRHFVLHPETCDPGGSATVSSWTGDISRIVTTAVHEIGHSVGLEHYGHELFGADDCKANYRSVMSYAYRVADFSLGPYYNPQGNPTLYEASPGLPGDPAPLLAVDPFAFAVDSGRVDWNRSGDFVATSQTPVRATITMPRLAAGQNSCNASARVNDAVHAAAVPARTPDIVRAGTRLYTFFIDADAKVRFKSVPVAPCLNEGTVNFACEDWVGLPQPTAGIPTAGNVDSISVGELGGKIYLAYRAVGGLSIRVIVGTESGGSWTWSGDGPANGDTLPAGAEPELSPIYVDGGVEALGLFYPSDGRFRWQRNYGFGWSAPQDVVDRDTALAVSAGGFAAAVAQWPPRFAAMTSWPTAEHSGACAVFPDYADRLYFYCYDRIADQWVLRPGIFGSPFTTSTNRRPSLAYHLFRTNGTTPLSTDAHGQFWVYTSQGTTHRLFITKGARIGASPLASTTDLAPFVSLFGAFLANVPVPGSSVSLFEDGAVGTLHGVRLRDPKNGPRLVESLPLFDATYRVATSSGVPVGLRDADDFKIMEAQICRGVREGASPPDSDAFCGTTGYWGY